MTRKPMYTPQSHPRMFTPEVIAALRQYAEESRQKGDEDAARYYQTQADKRAAAVAALSA